MIVSVVGPDDQRLLERAGGLELARPAPSRSRVWVTTAHSIAKPSTCSASLVEEALRDEQREVGVDVAGVLEAPVELALDRLPDRVALGADDHAALDRRIVGQLGRLDDVEVPLRVVLAARLDVLGHRAG